MRRTAVRLSERLKRLERDGLLAARLYSQRPPRAAYQLTAEGAELAGALRLLAHWGTRHTHRPTPRITPPAAPLSRPAGTARPATNSSTTKRKTPRRTTCNEQRPAEPAARTVDAVLSARAVPVGHETMAVPAGLAGGPVMRAADGSGSGRSGGTQTIPSLKPAEPIPNAALKRSMFTSTSKAVISTS